MSRDDREEVVRRLKAQHVGSAPVQFSPDQVRKMLVEVSQRFTKKRFKIEFDDGKNSKSDRDKSSLCTRKDRPMGMYVILPDGEERPLNIGFIRISEMKGLEELLNNL